MSQPEPAAIPPNEEKIKELKAEVYDLSESIQMHQQQAQKLIEVINERRQEITELESQRNA